MDQYILALDPGKEQDPAGLVGLRKRTPIDHDQMAAADVWGNLGAAGTDPARFEVGYCQRALGASYPALARFTAGVLGQMRAMGDARLVIDATGVGNPVVDIFREMGLDPLAIVFHGGTASRRDEADPSRWHVAKKDLVAAVQVLLGTGRLSVAPQLEEAPALQAELERFRSIRTTGGGERLEAEAGAHDDLVVALAMGAWVGLNPHLSGPVCW